MTDTTTSAAPELISHTAANKKPTAGLAVSTASVLVHHALQEAERPKSCTEKIHRPEKKKWWQRLPVVSREPDRGAQQSDNWHQCNENWISEDRFTARKSKSVSASAGGHLGTAKAGLI